VGLERGPLSLVSTTEELLGRKSSGSCLVNRDYGQTASICRVPTKGPANKEVAGGGKLCFTVEERLSTVGGDVSKCTHSTHRVVLHLVCATSWNVSHVFDSLCSNWMF
jgi:hypothetical protein